MDLEDTATVDDAKEQAAFASGFDAMDTPKPDKPEPAAATPRAEEPSAPEYVQITKSDWAEIKAAAAKTASYDQQLSKAFGTIGGMQRVINTLQSQTPRGGKIEISKEAFAEMEKDFPELAQQTRSALEKALSGVTGTGTAEVDKSEIERLVARRAAEREIEALEDAHPDWRDIVGAVDITTQQPDPNNPFRKWLGTKDATYQARVNNTESAAVITRAINLFRRETKAAPRSASADTRREQIASAVQPKGDGAPPGSSKSDDDEFLAGFNSRRTQ